VHLRPPPPVHRLVRGLRSVRRWTTVAQPTERHPTAPPRLWQAFFRVPRPGVRSGPAIAVTTRLRERSRTFLCDSRDWDSGKIRSKPSDAPDGLIFQRTFSIGIGKVTSNRERPAHRTSPPTENAIADRSDRSQRRRGGKDWPTGFSAVPGVCRRTSRITRVRAE
jgi:hypothetical protein